MSRPSRENGETTSFEQALDHEVETSLGRNTVFLQQLLRIPTPRMQEHQAVRFIVRALADGGCEVEVFEGEGTGEPLPGGPPINLLARRRGDGGGRSLLLEAHMDTVPPGDEKRWKHGPWSGEIEDGRIYARGAHDDRTGAAILCMVVDLLNRIQIRTRGDLYLMVTTEEEFSCGGMKAYAQKADRVRPDAHLLVDGNREAHLCIVGHAGALNFEIRIEGPFGSAQRHETVHDANPIELTGVLVRELRRFELEVRQELKELDADPRWPPAIVAVTETRSHGWFSNVPEECTLRGFCNVFPPMTLPEYKAAFEAFVGKVARSFDWLRSHPPAVRWGPLEVPPLVTSEDSEFFQALAGAHRRSFGTVLVPRYIGGWGDMCLLGCDNAIFYGPGGGGGDHSYDEYYELEDLAPMLKALAHLVVDWCGGSHR